MKHLSTLLLVVMNIVATSLNSWGEPTEEERYTRKIGPMTVYEAAAPVNQSDYCGKEKESYVYGATRRAVLKSLLNPSAKNIFEYTRCAYIGEYISRPVHFNDELYIYQSSPTKMVLVIAPERLKTYGNFFVKWDPVIEKRYQNWTFHEFDLITGAIDEKPMSQWPKGLIRPGLPVLSDCDASINVCQPGFRNVNFPEEQFMTSDGIALSAKMTPILEGTGQDKFEIKIRTSDGFETILYDPRVTFGSKFTGVLNMRTLRATENFIAFNFSITKEIGFNAERTILHPLYVVNRTTYKVQKLSVLGDFENELLYLYPEGYLQFDFFQVDKNSYGYNVGYDNLINSERSRSYIVNTNNIKPVVYYSNPKKVSNVSQDGRHLLLDVGKTEVQLIDIKNNQQVVSKLIASESARLYSVDIYSALEINPKGQWKFWKWQGSQFVEMISGTITEFQGAPGDPFRNLSIEKIGSEVCIYDHGRFDLSARHCFKY